MEVGFSESHENDQLNPGALHIVWAALQYREVL